MAEAHASETWTCPYCGLWGQTFVGDPEATNLQAHLRVVRCHEEPAAFGPRSKP